MDKKLENVKLDSNIVCFKKEVEKIKFLIILWIWFITGCSLPINRIENNYYLKTLESGSKLDTNGEIIEKWNWNGKEYYIQHVKTIQIQINKIHGDAIGGKEVDIVEIKYIDTSIEQGALSPFRGYEGILLVKEIVKMEENE